MSGPLSVYFADLFQAHHDNLCDEGTDQQIIAEVVMDNARLPTPSVGRQSMGNNSETHDSCHTRSTISTQTSTGSAASTGSNSSTGSCRWDSNPSSSANVKTDQLRRPKRPGRKTSDNNKNRSTRQPQAVVVDDRPIERPQRTNSSDMSKQQRRRDKPQRPNRTMSGERRSRNNSNNNSKVAPASSGDSLDKMLLCKQKVLAESDSDNSLKEIFRASKRVGASAMTKPLPGTRASAPRTVNEILGQSMEELKIAW